MDSQPIDNFEAYLEELVGYDTDFILTASDEELFHAGMGTILSDMDYAIAGGLSLADGGLTSGLVLVPLLLAAAAFAIKMVGAGVRRR